MKLGKYLHLTLISKIFVWSWLSDLIACGKSLFIFGVGWAGLERIGKLKCEIKIFFF